MGVNGLSSFEQNTYRSRFVESPIGLGLSLALAKDIIASLSREEIPPFGLKFSALKL